MARYAANLLLEYQVREAPQARPLCERRILVFEADSARNAIKQARQLGKSAQYRYKNADGQTVIVTFVGLVDVLDIDVLAPSQVYWSMKRTAHPKRHVRPDSELGRGGRCPSSWSRGEWPQATRGARGVVPKLTTACSRRRPGRS
jgi:hypothetical protein